jgi:hypothetical protein
MRVPSLLRKRGRAPAIAIALLGLAACGQGAVARTGSPHPGQVINGGPLVIHVTKPPTMVHVTTPSRMPTRVVQFHESPAFLPVLSPADAVRLPALHWQVVQRMDGGQQLEITVSVPACDRVKGVTVVKGTSGTRLTVLGTPVATAHPACTGTRVTPGRPTAETVDVRLPPGDRYAN